ncbi:MAG: hypothetical protein H7282_00690 [Cytophagaceae bacterium]|nr:hypothetical protein [Cytophagaceae bacterium]
MLQCYNRRNFISNKTEAFADFTIGTMPIIGPHVNYMKPYIDAIWTKYTNEDLIFNAGDAGIWKGKVDNQDRLVMYCQNTTGGFVGKNREGLVLKLNDALN